MKYKVGDKVKVPQHLTIWTIDAITPNGTYIIKSGYMYEQAYIEEVDSKWENVTD